MNDEEYQELSEKEQIALCKKVEQEALEEMTKAWVKQNDDFGRQAAWVLLAGLVGILIWQTFW